MSINMCRAASRWLGIFAVGTATSLQAQVPELVAAGSFPESFGYLSNVRELSDGRVMVADPLGQVLVVVDLQAGTADTLGRVGGGPEEYRQPDAVFALPGDSTLLVDLGNARLTVVDPALAFGQTYSATQGAGQAMVLVLPRFVDARGNPYFLQQSFGRGGMPDSATVMRFDRLSGESEAIARVKLPEIEETGGGGARMIRMRPLSPRDDWAVAQDGRVAVVSAADYSVTWIHPDGRVVTGPPNQYRPVRVGEAEKELWSGAMMRSGLSVGMQVSTSGERNVSLSRGGGGGPQSPFDSADWPDVAPAFRYGGAVIAPNGDLWVERYVPSGEDPLFDVFDGEGRKRGELRFPAGRQVVGFGDGTVYLARIDEDDLQWLECYRMKR
jgi:hypothetical protein